MKSDYETYFCGSDPLASSWEKVTKRIVDPITFSCHVNIAYIPRIEDCAYETTNIAIGQPRFGDAMLTTAATNGSKNSHSALPSTPATPKRTSSKSKNKDESAWTPHTFPPTSPTPSTQSSPTKQSKNKNKVAATKSGGDGKGASLGAFFSKASTTQPVTAPFDMDNQSVGSRSISSRSVSERSIAERSKSEEKLKSRRAKKHNNSGDMMSIDEQSVSDFIEKKKKSKSRGSSESSSGSGGGGVLGKFLNDKSSAGSPSRVEDDNRSTMSGSTIGSRSISVLSTADRSKHEARLKSARAVVAAKTQVEKSDSNEPESPTKKEHQPSEGTAAVPLKPALKKEGAITKQGRKLQFTEGHDMLEVPTLDDKEYYKDWDDIWYSDDELGDMRYEAFLEEAGLDVNEFM